MDAGCPPNELQKHIRWDAPTSVCFRETTSKLKNVDPPETVYEVEIIDNSECCDAEHPDACTKTYEYKPNQDKCFESYLEISAEAAEGKEACCLEGWNTDDANLKAACDIKKEVYEFDGSTCTLTLLDILPHMNDEKTSKVDVQGCCDNANGDKALEQACSFSQDPVTHIFVRDYGTWDEATTAC